MGELVLLLIIYITFCTPLGFMVLGAALYMLPILVVIIGTMLVIKAIASMKEKHEAKKAEQIKRTEENKKDL